MASAAETIASQSSGSVPYVGLRPFEPQERNWFFGRNRDAQILCDRILCSRVTILYALSGLGKSSLLRALVMPKLEENQSRLVYFDTWSQADPLHALKENLAGLASRLGVPGAGYASLSLIELVQLVSSVDDRNLVLVFDQFEEFLVRHAQNLDPFRTELAALIRASKFDVAVVLTLREEFLASLEPFRQQILNLFQSAYRLEGLSKEHLVEAIREPARIFGGDCEEELARELIKDLQGGEAEIIAGPQLSLGLPMLQLVCQELWKRAPGGRLSLVLYEQMGRARRIIDDYVRGLMPRERKARNFTARLLVYLAPPSNLKMSYSVEDLADITGLASAGIETELKRLEAARILRTREYGGLRYELQHDAFIPVLRSWRNEVLEQSRRRQWMMRMAGAAAVAIVVLFAILSGLYAREKSLDRQRHEAQARNAMREQITLQREAASKEKALRQLADRNAAQAEASRLKLEQWETGGLLAELDSEKGGAMQVLAPARIDELTSYFLLNRSDPQRFRDLKAALQRYEKYIPGDYAEPVTEDNGSAWDAPLKLTYSSSRTLDPAHFMIVWRNFGKSITHDYGIPVPFQIHFEKRDVPKEQMTFTGAEAEPVVLDVPANDEQYLIRYPLEKLAPSSAKEFLEHYQEDWVLLNQWRLVPKWSLPVWKLAKGMTKSTDVPEWYEIATSPSGIAAYRALLHLMEKENPRIFFSEPAAKFLLQNVPQTYRTTLDEAVAARGACLPSDVAGRLQKIENAFALPVILDELAERPAEQSCKAQEGLEAARNAPIPARAVSNTGSTLEAEVKADRLKNGSVEGDQMRGPWATSAPGLKQLTSAEYKTFSGLEGSLPSYEPLHVYVGEALSNAWIPNNQPSKDLAAGLEQLRAEMYRQYGVAAPLPTFSDSPALGSPPGAHAIRIQVTVDPAQSSTLALVNGDRVMKGTDPSELVNALRPSYQGTRALWITPEATIAYLTQLPDETQAWLQAKYSITDLKRLLRMTIVSGEPGEGASVRYASWLLNSLVFWATEENKGDAMNLIVMRDHLRHLQKVRMDYHAAASVSGEVRRDVERGVQELVANHTDVAVRDFQTALARDRAGTAEAFCEEWSKRFPEIWLRDHRPEFRSLRDLKLDTRGRLDLQDVAAITSGNPDPKISRELKIYRLAAGLDTQDEASAVKAFLASYRSSDGWPAEQARWTAVRFFSQYDPTDSRTGGQREFEAATALMKSAIRNLDRQGAFDAFSDVEKLSWSRPDNGQYRSTPNWCWRLLSELVETRPGGAPLNLQLELAWQLAEQERLDRLKQSQSLLGNFEQVMRSAQLSADDRSQQEELVTYTRARIDRTLLLVRDDNSSFSEAERLFRLLLKAKRDDIRQASRRELVRTLYEEGHDKDAQALIGEFGKDWPADPYARAVDMFAQIERGNSPEIVKIADAERREAEAQRKLGNNDDANGALFYAALGLMVTQSGDWRDVVKQFIDQGTQHQYRDYVIMMFCAYSPQRDSAGTWLLDRRWAEIKPESWPNRLTNGDMSAWREMLIGRFKNDPQSNRIFEVIEDDGKWRASGLSQLPVSRRGQRCEAWFYEAMRAKRNGQLDYMRDCLKKCLRAGVQAYDENGMAAFLLRQMGESVRPSAHVSSSSAFVLSQFSASRH